MKTIYQFPQDKLDADVEVKREGGAVKVIISPYFWQADSKAVTAFVQTMDDEDNVIQREIQQQSGVNGKMVHIKRGAPVVPRYEVNKKKHTAAAEAAAGASK